MNIDQQNGRGGTLPGPGPSSKSSPILNANEAKARGANRSTKVAGKLQVLPDAADKDTDQLPAADLQALKPPPAPISAERAGGGEPSSAGTASDEEDADDEEDEGEDEQDAEVYTQIAQIPEGTARRDALRLTKRKAKTLPRVTAYATAASYRMPELMKFFQARKPAYQTQPRLIDEVLYTTYSYSLAPQDAPSKFKSPTKNTANPPVVGDLLGLSEGAGTISGGEDNQDGSAPVKVDRKRRKFDAGGGTNAEIFIFEYGTLVIWGMTESEEKRFLSSIKRFEVERLAIDDVEMEDLNYYYANYSRIFNDVITLRRGSGFMTKLSLSHALSQSVKISLFENLIASNIEHTKDVPDAISETGKIGMPHKEIMQQIGELFLLRININLVGSVLDSPEVFWSYPDLQPLYEAARTYLEIPQRVNLLNTRVEVLQDMLQLLKESVSSKHSERLEQIVIALIVVEIVLGIITIIVDLFA